MNLDQVRRRTTITVPEAGDILGIGRDAAYAAASRGEIPTLRLGRRIVVPVPRLLELIGIRPETEEGAPGRTPISAVPSTHLEEDQHDEGTPTAPTAA